jgi:hypothetical protein
MAPAHHADPASLLARLLISGSRDNRAVGIGPDRRSASARPSSGYRLPGSNLILVIALWSTSGGVGIFPADAEPRELHLQGLCNVMTGKPACLTGVSRTVCTTLARRPAEPGCSASHIAAKTGHATVQGQARYTKTEEQRRLALAVIDAMPHNPASRLPNWTAGLGEDGKNTKVIRAGWAEWRSLRAR